MHLKQLNAFHFNSRERIFIKHESLAIHKQLIPLLALKGIQINKIYSKAIGLIALLNMRKYAFILQGLFFYSPTNKANYFLISKKFLEIIDIIIRLVFR